MSLGTRTGDIDPGVLVYLAREKNFDAAQLEDLVDRRSGLLGISGVIAHLVVSTCWFSPAGLENMMPMFVPRFVTAYRG